MRTSPGRAFRPLMAGDPRHGSLDGYNNHDCRCPLCKEAASEYGRTYYLEVTKPKRTADRSGVNAAQRRYYARHRAEVLARDKQARNDRTARRRAALGDPGCIVCGSRPIQWDHVDKSTKSRSQSNIAAMIALATDEDFFAEMALVQPLCAPHHRSKYSFWFFADRGIVERRKDVGPNRGLDGAQFIGFQIGSAAWFNQLGQELMGLDVWPLDPAVAA